MGFFSGLGKALRGVASVALPAIGTAIGGPVGGGFGRAVGGFVGSQVGARVGRSSRLSIAQVGAPALPAVLRTPRLPAPSRRPTMPIDFLPDLGVEGPGIFTARGCPPGFHLAKDGSGRCVRNRRMNPTNHKAAMRAARRLIAFRKAVMRTEKALRKAVPPSRRRAPSGHRARLTHS